MVTRRGREPASIYRVTASDFSGRAITRVTFDACVEDVTALRIDLKLYACALCVGTFDFKSIALAFDFVDVAKALRRELVVNLSDREPRLCGCLSGGVLCDGGTEYDCANEQAGADRNGGKELGRTHDESPV
ncbi:MAG TPA: hypothetical protein VIQ01_03955 [Burkholderiales bacterium]